MIFELSDRAKLIEEQLQRFMTEEILPAERVYLEQVEAGGDPHAEPPIMTELRAKAKGIGLWNLFLPGEEWGAEVPLGEGDVGMENFLRTLAELGYDGPLTIEREIPEEPERQKAEIGQGVSLLNELKAKIL